MFRYKPITKRSIIKTKYLYHLTSRDNLEEIKKSGILKGRQPSSIARLMMALSTQYKSDVRQIYFFRSLKRTFGARKNAEVCIKISAGNSVVQQLLTSALHRKIDNAIILETEFLDLSAMCCAYSISSELLQIL